mgnify:CR=1 FL=1|tara:strand:- start:44092 stop:44475 length:384 start_codon:yes stop_codon:yes gene_type:complete
MTRASIIARRNWCLLLIAAALLMRAVVPAGMMTGTDADGSITIEICNSDAQWHLPVKSKHSGKSDTEMGAGHCLFAGHAGGDAAPPLPVLALPFAVTTSLFAGFATPAAAFQHARQLPPARAPPVVA